MLVTGPNEISQACQRSLQVRLRVRGRIHFLCVSTVQHAQYGEIERDCGSSEKTFKWQSSKEGQLQKETPSKIGCFQGLWHWDQFTGKSAVTLTPTSKWRMRSRWTQRYLECADTKFRISSPEVTEEPWVKFNTVRRGNGIRFLERVWNKKRIGIDSLY